MPSRTELPSPPPTTRADIDRALSELSDHKSSWLTLSLDDKIRLIRRARSDTYAAAKEWIDTACAIKRISPDSPTSAEERIGGPMLVLRGLRLLEDTATVSKFARTSKRQAGSDQGDRWPADHRARVPR